MGHSSIQQCIIRTIPAIQQTAEKKRLGTSVIMALADGRSYETTCQHAYMSCSSLGKHVVEICFFKSGRSPE